MDKLPSELFFQTKMLQRAILSSSVSRVKYLLKSVGCDPNVACGLFGLRPLIIACYIKDERKRMKTIELLLESGADPGLPDYLGRHSLYYACWLGLLDVLNLLIQVDDSDLTEGDRKDGNTCLHVCAMLGHVELLEVLIKKVKRTGIGLNKKNYHGLTALSLAYECNKMDCFKLLHDEGALPQFVVSDFNSILIRKPSINLVIQYDVLVFRKTRGYSLPYKQKHTNNTLNVSSTASSNTIIKTLLEKAASQKVHDILKKCPQTPVTNEWIQSILNYRAAPPPVATKDLSARVRFRALCARKKSRRKGFSSFQISTNY